MAGKAHQGEAFYPYYQLYRGNLHSCGRYHIETIDPFHTHVLTGNFSADGVKLSLFALSGDRYLVGRLVREIYRA